MVKLCEDSKATFCSVNICCVLSTGETGKQGLANGAVVCAEGLDVFRQRGISTGRRIIPLWYLSFQQKKKSMFVSDLKGGRLGSLWLNACLV
jgi:hypothetical protein